MRGYPRHLVDHILSEVKFTERESALQQTQKQPRSQGPLLPVPWSERGEREGEDPGNEVETKDAK